MKIVDKYVNSFLQSKLSDESNNLDDKKLKLKSTTKTKCTASTRRMKNSSKISSNKM